MQFLIAIFLTFCVGTYACIVTGSATYDLSTIPNVVGLDQDAQWSYTVSPCLNNIPCAAPCTSPGAGYCQFNVQNPSTIFCIGTSVSAKEKAGGGGVEIRYRDEQDDRTGVVTINCDPAATTPTNIKAVSPVTKDGYTFSFSSAAACPKSGLSGGTIFLIIFFSCILLFVIGGVIYNLAVNKAEGAQLFSHIGYVKVGLGLSQEGVMFLVQKVKG